jgi:hypothetical protein
LLPACRPASPSWDKTEEDAEAAGARVIAVDRPGYGETRAEVEDDDEEGGREAGKEERAAAAERRGERAKGSESPEGSL